MLTAETKGGELAGDEQLEMLRCKQQVKFAKEEREATNEGAREKRKKERGQLGAMLLADGKYSCQVLRLKEANFSGQTCSIVPSFRRE